MPTVVWILLLASWVLVAWWFAVALGRSASRAEVYERRRREAWLRAARIAPARPRRGPRPRR